MVGSLLFAPARAAAVYAFILASTLVVCAGEAAAATMTPGPSPTVTPLPAPALPAQSGMDMASMRYNANGVMSMYGMSKSMNMSMSSMDPATMPSVVDAGSPMSRGGSGTSWMPEAGTMYGRMFGRGDDMLMSHGTLFAEYMHTATPRGGGALSAPGWFMFMRTHPTSPGAQVGFRAMLTPDPFTVGGQGYPVLFQSGESWHNVPLHDYQHPHDLVSELSASYSGQLGTAHSAFLYVAYPGEPALGPPAFMHRPLAYDYASTPISHHWQDSTHISFGVITAGISSAKFRVEGSTFTGREPNEARYNFDPVDLNSVSGRISWNPNAYVAAQGSYGFIKSPESTTPRVNVRRTTASILYTRPVAFDSYWTSALVWGENNSTDGERSNSFLYETDYRRNANAFFARIENVQKSGHELVLSGPLESGLYDIGGYTVGAVHDLKHAPGRTVTGIGVAMTLNSKPAALDPVYGSGVPFSFQVYLRLRPPALSGQDLTH